MHCGIKKCRFLSKKTNGIIPNDKSCFDTFLFFKDFSNLKDHPLPVNIHFSHTIHKGCNPAITIKYITSSVAVSVKGSSDLVCKPSSILCIVHY